MDALDPDIKARFNHRDELFDFLRHYDMAFPCSVPIWHGQERPLWLVTTDRPDEPPAELRTSVSTFQSFLIWHEPKVEPRGA